MTPGRLVYQTGRPGTLRSALYAHGGTLALFSLHAQNTMKRAAMNAGGDAWRAAFLPKRFSSYVERRPFPYPRHNIGFYLAKARRMGLLKVIFQRFLGGWDPWGNERIPDDRFMAWLKHERAAGNFGKSRTGEFKTARSEFRQWAKRLVRNQIAEMRDKKVFEPLIESGGLAISAIINSRTVATSTAKRTILRIKIPFPGPRNPRVAEVIKTLPRWEVAYIAKHAGIAMRHWLNAGTASSVQLNRRGQRTLTGAASRVSFSAPSRTGTSPFSPSDAAGDALAG